MCLIYINTSTLRQMSDQLAIKLIKLPVVVLQRLGSIMTSPSSFVNLALVHIGALICLKESKLIFLTKFIAYLLWAMKIPSLRCCTCKTRENVSVLLLCSFQILSPFVQQIHTLEFEKQDLKQCHQHKSKQSWYQNEYS